jgi:hypothetical protein
MECKRWNNLEIHNFILHLIIVRLIRSRKMKWPEQVACERKWRYFVKENSREGSVARSWRRRNDNNKMNFRTVWCENITGFSSARNTYPNSKSFLTFRFINVMTGRISINCSSRLLPLDSFFKYTVTHMRVIIEGVWIGNRIYWTLIQLLLHFTNYYHTQTSVLSL